MKIIKHVRPAIWTLENPVGLLRDQPFMQKFAKYRNTTTSCKWGKPFRKPADLWSNARDLNLPICSTSKTTCAHKARHGHHAMTAQSGAISSGVPGSGGGKNAYPLPSRLVCHVFNKWLEQVKRKLEESYPVSTCQAPGATTSSQEQLPFLMLTRPHKRVPAVAYTFDGSEKWEVPRLLSIH